METNRTVTAHQANTIYSKYNIYPISRSFYWIRHLEHHKCSLNNWISTSWPFKDDPRYIKYLVSENALILRFEAVDDWSSNLFLESDLYQTLSDLGSVLNPLLSTLRSNWIITDWRVLINVSIKCKQITIL